jgi:hypothetical protein
MREDPDERPGLADEAALADCRDHDASQPPQDGNSMIHQQNRAVARATVIAMPAWLALAASFEACSLLAPSDGELLGGGGAHREAGADSEPGGAAGGGGGGVGATEGSGGSHAVRDAAVRDATAPDAPRDTGDAVTDAQRPDPDSTPSPCGNASCANPGAPLDHLRLELHCAARMGTSNSCNLVLPAGLTSCPKEGLTVHESVTFGGDPAKLYRVVLRFRGVVEPKQYAGGVPDVAGSNGQFYEGGSGAGDPIYNAYGLTIADPPQDYHLNAWMEGDFVLALDYRETLSVRGGTAITLYGYTKLCALSYDCADLSKAPDCSPKSLAGVAHLPDKGQFIQLDAESVSVLP